MNITQAYNYNDHGISEQWMQTYVGKGKTSAEAEAGDPNTGGNNSNSNSSGSVSDNTGGPALSDEASRTQVRFRG